jgi:uncharacterized membrane protein
VKSDGSNTVEVTVSTTKTIVLAGLPPAIWSTIGFLLLLLAVMVLALAALVAFMLFRRRRRRKE